MRPHCFARCRPVSRVLGCTGIAEGVAFLSPAFMRGMYFSNLILVNAVNHLYIHIFYFILGCKLILITWT